MPAQPALKVPPVSQAQPDQLAFVVPRYRVPPVPPGVPAEQASKAQPDTRVLKAELRPVLLGPTGLTGARGQPGPMGETGAQGRPGVVSCWTSYRDFWFADGRADLHDAEMAKVSEIVTYMKKNPSLHLGIDASLDSQNYNKRDQDLSNQRVKAIRDALINAGIPANKIQVGPFGDPELRRARRVEVLLRECELARPDQSPNVRTVGEPSSRD